jgi:hypothetical protein
MAGGIYVVFAGDEVWRVASRGAVDEVRFDREAGAKQIAARIAGKLRERGYQGEGLLLALPGSWCLSAEISTADLPRQDRAAMAFRLEEKLPLAAEHFTADFAIEGDRALGVCVPNERVGPLVEALEGAGVVVASVSPAVMLAAQEMVRGDEAKHVSGHFLIWGEDAEVNLISLEGNRPTAWALTRDDPRELAMQLDLSLMQSGQGAEIVACELRPEAIEALREAGHQVSQNRLKLDAAVIRIAGDVLSGAVLPWFELRRGEMAVEDRFRAVRRPLNAALLVAVVICFVLALAFLYRSVRYDHLANSDEKSLADEFQKEFPGMTVPINPQATLLSEKRKLTMAGTSALPAQAQESALRVLRDVLTKIPPGSNLSIDHMTFNDTSLELSGKSRANEDVDALVVAARAAGMDVPQPQTRKDAAGHWTFLVKGSKPGKTPLASGKR